MIVVQVSFVVVRVFFGHVSNFGCASDVSDESERDNHENAQENKFARQEGLFRFVGFGCGRNFDPL